MLERSCRRGSRDGNGARESHRKTELARRYGADGRPDETSPSYIILSYLRPHFRCLAHTPRAPCSRPHALSWARSRLHVRCAPRASLDWLHATTLGLRRCRRPRRSCTRAAPRYGAVGPSPFAPPPPKGPRYPSKGPRYPVRGTKLRATSRVESPACGWRAPARGCAGPRATPRDSGACPH